MVVYVGYSILFYYDLMIVKLICWVCICEECIMKMEWVLDEFIIEGIKIMVLFYQCLMKDEKFCVGNFNIGFLVDFNMEEQVDI